MQYADYGTKWTAYKNKEQAEGEYDSLVVENEVLKRDKENLERTIEEMNEVLEANGITIDSDGNVNDSQVEEAKKQTAKEIIQIMKQVQAMFYDKEYVAIQNLIAEKYGVEVDE